MDDVGRLVECRHLFIALAKVDAVQIVMCDNTAPPTQCCSDHKRSQPVHAHEIKINTEDRNSAAELYRRCCCRSDHVSKLKPLPPEKLATQPRDKLSTFVGQCYSN